MLIQGEYAIYINSERNCKGSTCFPFPFIQQTRFSTLSPQHLGFLGTCAPNFARSLLPVFKLASKHPTEMCHMTGYCAYCKACFNEMPEKSSTNYHICDFVRNRNLEFAGCDDFKDRRVDWPRYCEPCQIAANNAIRQGQITDRNWAAGRHWRR